MPRAPHRPSQRSVALDAATDLLRKGAGLSLESVARHAGITKPGLMYHFPTKEALMVGLIDHLVDGYERDLLGFAQGGVAAPVKTRFEAYVRWCITFDHDAADLVVYSDAKLRDQMHRRWTERLGGWLEIPPSIDGHDRARLHAARLLADGWWLADATGLFPVPLVDRPTVLDCALSHLEGLGT